MAIQKEKTLQNGSVGNYWRIIDISIDRQRLKITGTLDLFKDAATSAAGKPPLGCPKRFQFDLNLTEFLAAPNAIAFIYGKIKAKAETVITVDLLGKPLITSTVYDPDLANGTMV